MTPIIAWLVGSGKVGVAIDAREGYGNFIRTYSARQGQHSMTKCAGSRIAGHVW